MMIQEIQFRMDLRLLKKAMDGDQERFTQMMMNIM